MWSGAVIGSVGGLLQIGTVVPGTRYHRVRESDRYAPNSAHEKTFSSNLVLIDVYRRPKSPAHSSVSHICKTPITYHLIAS